MSGGMGVLLSPGRAPLQTPTLTGHQDGRRGRWEGAGGGLGNEAPGNPEATVGQALRGKSKAAPSSPLPGALCAI